MHTLWHHGSTKEKEAAVKTSGYVSSSSFDYMREENRSAAGLDREKMKAMTLADVEKRIDDGLLAFGNAKHVTDKLIADAERYGANSLLLMMSLGAMPQDVFLKQLRRFAKEVLPSSRRTRSSGCPPRRRSKASCSGPTGITIGRFGGRKNADATRQLWCCVAPGTQGLCRA